MIFYNSNKLKKHIKEDYLFKFMMLILVINF
jgi:hypothetical protein